MRIIFTMIDIFGDTLSVSLLITVSVGSTSSNLAFVEFTFDELRVSCLGRTIGNETGYVVDTLMSVLLLLMLRVTVVMILVLVWVGCQSLTKGWRLLIFFIESLVDFQGRRNFDEFVLICSGILGNVWQLIVANNRLFGALGKASIYLASLI